MKAGAACVQYQATWVLSDATNLLTAVDDYKVLASRIGYV